jgi:ubiquinol-cytochrome c reductase cytochrome c subunit
VSGLAGRVLLTLPLLAGTLCALFVHPSTAAPASAAPDARRIYLADCATCHQADGTGSNRGPSLLGAGTAGLDFYLSTGRMPLSSPRQAVQRRAPAYGDATITALIDYISQFAGFHGPDIPHVDIANANVASGGVSYRLNCAACHAWSGRGGALLHREAPALGQSTPRQIVEAILVGPGNMPSFGPPALDRSDQEDVAAYTVEVSRHPVDRGGLPLWHLGPLAEGAVAVFAGLVLLLGLARAIGTRA